MEAALSVENLRAYYLMRYFGVIREVRAVDDISLEVKRNEIYGLAGESSSGKTTFIKTIAAAIRPPLEVVGGSIKYSFLDRDIYGLSPEALSAIRWKHLSYITQGSMNVLNPIRRVRQSFVDFALRHMGRSKREAPGLAYPCGSGVPKQAAHTKLMALLVSLLRKSPKVGTRLSLNNDSKSAVFLLGIWR